jgi:hypothetical protein
MPRLRNGHAGALPSGPNTLPVGWWMTFAIVDGAHNVRIAT